MAQALQQNPAFCTGDTALPHVCLTEEEPRTIFEAKSVGCLFVWS